MDDEMGEMRHKKCQARLSRELLIEAAEKLGVSPSSTEEKSVEKDTVERALSEGVTLEKVASEEIAPVKLTDVVVRTNGICKDEDIIGTLEAHLNEFQFLTSRANFQIKFLHKNVSMLSSISVRTVCRSCTTTCTTTSWWGLRKRRISNFMGRRPSGRILLAIQIILRKRTKTGTWILSMFSRNLSTESIFIYGTV